eukprot:CAMPEP_0197529874 /NCGR_PEP_ID=MMETSP1318-20131121/29913_1 /TAXON_ID=552666 /ORGANISM="Partenskyella glossopodia, Strain RCC365" /LENGTH=417 /DNA_ID=CAMNT_0043085489 /DNA_START=283 /DNA_END=1536 /DNA_ORIENTATION=+
MAVLSSHQVDKHQTKVYLSATVAQRPIPSTITYRHTRGGRGRFVRTRCSVGGSASRQSLGLRGGGQAAGRPKRRILVTGGTGYIGSHTVVQLLESGYDVTVVDNLVNSNEKVLDRIDQICSKRPKFFQVDICDETQLENVFRTSPKFDAVIHFAGLKAVGESVAQPTRYWENNVCGSVSLLKIMRKYNCTNIVFSSSATVYGQPKTVPITEEFPLQTTNPYGSTKLAIETMLRDVAKENSQDNEWRIVLLRYFNPIGAHPSGLIGEDPSGIPNNLLPYISQVAVGRRSHLSVFGGDYDTPDGTGVRDYIHVQDLSRGHLLAIENALFGKMSSNCEVYNLGTGQGYSVLDIVKAFGKACGKDVPYKIVDRRAGDVAKMFADASKAKNHLAWSAKLGIDDMCKDAWKWQQSNPNGYRSE